MDEDEIGTVDLDRHSVNFVPSILSESHCLESVGVVDFGGSDTGSIEITSAMPSTWVDTMSSVQSEQSRPR
jgi:hypothetical protein